MGLTLLSFMALAFCCAIIFNLQVRHLEDMYKLEDEKKFSGQKEMELEDAKKANIELISESLEKKEIEKFIADAINAKPVDNKSLREYRRLLDKDYQDYANKNDSLAEEARAYKQLLEVQQELELLASDPMLNKKRSIAICGSFNSGKSSFLNSFFSDNDIELPTDMLPTTAIPAYIVNDISTQIIGYSSITRGQFSVSKAIFNKLRHNGEDDNGKFKTIFKKIIDKIVLKTEFVHDFDKICFIDTPGFNSGSDNEEDDNTAMSAISGANAVIWCFRIDRSPMESELNILSEIPEYIPIYIVCTQADSIGNEEMRSQIDKIKENLADSYIKYEGISLYTAKQKFNSQPEEYFEFADGKSLVQFLEDNNQNNTEKQKDLILKIKKIFGDYIDADRKRIDKTKKNMDILFNVKDFITQKRTNRKAKNKKDLDEINKENKMFDTVNAQILSIIEDWKYIKISDSIDIQSAEKLCDKFIKCVRDIFRQTNFED